MWVETFRAPTGARRQTTTQLYGGPTGISDDGTVLAVGCEVASGVWETRVYRDEQPGGWRLQQTIPNSGFSVAVSGSGNRLALGNIFPGSLQGTVQVFRWDEATNTWLEEVVDLPTYRSAIQAAAPEMLGYSVALDGAGLTMIVGLKQYSGESAQAGVGSTGRMRGSVAIYGYDALMNKWRVQLQQVGDSDMARLGHAVAVSRDGETASASEGAGSRVYSFARQADRTTWLRTETVLSPVESVTSGFGNSLSLAAAVPGVSGTLMCVAAWKDVVDLPRGHNGKVRFYALGSVGGGEAASVSTWQEVRPAIAYTYPNGMFGASVSMSADGSVVAIGTNSFLGGIYTYQWDEASQAWKELRHLPISTNTALGRAVSLSASGTRMLYVERASKEFVVADYILEDSSFSSSSSG